MSAVDAFTRAEAARIALGGLAGGQRCPLRIALSRCAFRPGPLWSESRRLAEDAELRDAVAECCARIARAHGGSLRAAALEWRRELEQWDGEGEVPL